jgi:hypothetical protein
VRWWTTLGQREIVVQRFLHQQKLVVPFMEGSELNNRDYSILLERAIVDFGADNSFGQAAEKFREHYGIEVPGIAIQLITKKHAEATYVMQEEEATLGGKSKGRCLIGEMDGAMIPMVIFEANAHADKRKWRKTCWKEARLSVAREHKSLTKIFLATLGSTERAGDLLERCAKRLGYNEQTKIHCLGDGAFWIQEQVERKFGTQGSYLVDFFHLSEYLAGAAEKSGGEAKNWLRARQEELKQGQLDKVVAQLKKCDGAKEENGPVRKCLRYIENRPGQFKYKEALMAELPIGSGEIESGNRSVVQKRLKIPGAWWKPQTAEWMLALRCMRMNGDWERYWRRVSPIFARAA